jgi:hypothetical protein
VHGEYISDTGYVPPSVPHNSCSLSVYKYVYRDPSTVLTSFECSCLLSYETRESAYNDLHKLVLHDGQFNRIHKQINRRRMLN